MIRRLFELVTEVQSTSGTNAKKEVLKREINNENFKQFVKYVIDPELKYGVREKKLQKFRGKVDDIVPLTSLFETFDYLIEHNTGKDEYVKIAESYIESEEEQYHDFLTKAITKTLKLGVEKKAIFECFPGLIDDFDVMRAKSYHDYTNKVDGKEFILDEKKNGIRCIYRKEGNSIVPKTRQNKVITGLKSLTHELSTLPDGVYEGELLIKDAEQYNHQDILQRTVEIVNNKDIEDKVLDYWLFDYTTLDEFDGKVKSRNYFDRRDEFKQYDGMYNNIKVIPEIYRGKDITIIQPLLEEYVAKGREGLVVHLNKPYKKGKTDYILKVKMQYTSDLKCIGFNEGKKHSKFEGTLGSIVFYYKGFELGVGSMPDEIRDEIWNNQDKYLGMIGEVSHFEESSNAKGGKSVSYPSFIMWREPGKQVDYAHE